MIKALYFLICFHFTSKAFCQSEAIIHEKRSDGTGTNYALVVGISHYAHVKQLNYAHEDAYLFADYLVNNHICKKLNVKLLIDSMGTNIRIYQELERLLNDAKSNDRVFIYFSGHGDIENRLQSGFLITYNSEPHNYPAYNIDVSMLERYVKSFVDSNIKVVLITDACHGLAGSETTANSITNGFKNTIKLLSCQPNELSQEKYYPGGGHGIFTYHLVNGLNGLADTRGKHYITVDDIEEYLLVVKKETNQKQHAKVYGDGTAIISKYDEAIKQSTFSRANSNSAYIVTRDLSDSIFENNSYYQKFNEQVRNGRLIEPVGENAYNTIEQAIAIGQPGKLVNEMKLQLGAALEDEAQLWLNKYLRGEMDRKVSKLIKGVFKVKMYLETLELLKGEKGFRYDEIRAKKIFFGACYDFFTSKEKKIIQVVIDSLKIADRLMPNQAWILHLMAHCYEELKQFDDAGISFKRALELAPAWVNGWSCLESYYENTKRFEDAKSLIQKCIGIDSARSWGWAMLGDYYSLHKKNSKEAERCYRKAIRLDSTFSIAWQNLGADLKSRKNYEEAEIMFKKAAECSVLEDDMFNNLTNIWNALGQIHGLKKNYTEAEAAFKSAILADSMNSDAFQNLDLLYQYIMSYEFRTLLSKGVEGIDGMNRFADFYMCQKKYQQAKEIYEKILQFYPDNNNAWYNLSSVNSRLNKMEKALTYLEKALENGYNNFTHIEEDNNLENIRNSEKFLSLIKKYKNPH